MYSIEVTQPRTSFVQGRPQPGSPRIVTAVDVPTAARALDMRLFVSETGTRYTVPVIRSRPWSATEVTTNSECTARCPINSELKRRVACPGVTGLDSLWGLVLSIIELPISRSLQPRTTVSIVPGLCSVLSSFIITSSTLVCYFETIRLVEWPLSSDSSNAFGCIISPPQLVATPGPAFYFRSF
jgi:hypothetical protein